MKIIFHNTTFHINQRCIIENQNDQKQILLAANERYIPVFAFPKTAVFELKVRKAFIYINKFNMLEIITSHFNSLHSYLLKAKCNFFFKYI